MTNRQNFRTADRVRLEVQRDDQVTTNVVRNGTPELGTYGWVTPLTNMTLTVSGNSFRLTSLVAAPAAGTGQPGSTRTISAPMPITAGKWAAAALDAQDRQVPGNTTIAIEFYDASGTLLALTGQASGSSGRITTPPTQAPTGTVAFRVRVSGIVPAGTGAGWWQDFTNVAARVGTVAGDVGVVPYTEPYEWLNILGTAHTIEAMHDGIGLGTLNATLYDATLDPAVSTALRSGRQVRLTAMDTDGVWQSVWRGTILNGRADYDLAQRNPDHRAKIQLSAVNGVAQASNLTRTRGVATTAELAFLLEGASIPWAVNGNGTQPAGTPTYITTNPDASLLDQIAITRDSRHAYAWLDRRGVLNTTDPDQMPTTPVATLTEADYTELAVDYDTERCINDFTVKLLRTNLATGQTGEVTYGPFRDQASIDTWGAHGPSDGITVQGLTEPEVNAYAAAVLAANATPTRKVNSLRLVVTKPEDLTTTPGQQRAMVDTYSTVQVTNAAAGLDQQLRPTTITHTLTADAKTDKWLMDLEFATVSAAATPIQVPSPPGPSVAAGSAAALDPGMQAGTVSLTFTGGTTATATVAFDQAYPATPHVVPVAVGTDARIVLAVFNKTATGCTVYGTFPIALSGTVPIDWVATRRTQ